MPLLNLLLNLLWLFTGGLWMALAWVIAGLFMAATIIGLPWTFAAFRNARYTLLPFGYRVVDRALYEGRESLATGPLGVLGNIIWLVLGAWWIVILHLLHAFVLALSIIGLPFAWAHLKLAGLALWPIGRVIVPVEDADRIRYGRYGAWRRV